MKYRFDNMDASENAFFSRQLETIRPGLIEIKRPDLKGFSLVPVRTLPAGAETFTVRSSETYGKAELRSALSRRGDRSNVKVTEETVIIRSMASSYAFDIQEIRAAQLAGMDLDVRKAQGARRAIAELHDKVVLEGDGTASYLGLRGLFNLQNTLAFSTPTGTGGKAFSTKTPDEIVLDLQNLQNAIVQNSLEAHRPTTMVMPLSIYNHLSTRRMGDGSSQTVLEFFRGTSLYVTEIVTSTKLETAGTGGSKRIVCYEKSPDVLEALVPVEFEQMPPQWDGYESVTQCHGRTGGVICHFPKAVSYADEV